MEKRWNMFTTSLKAYKQLLTWLRSTSILFEQVSTIHSDSRNKNLPPKVCPKTTRNCTAARLSPSFVRNDTGELNVLHDHKSGRYSVDNPQWRKPEKPAFFGRVRCGCEILRGPKKRFFLLPTTRVSILKILKIDLAWFLAINLGKRSFVVWHFRALSLQWKISMPRFQPWATVVGFQRFKDFFAKSNVNKSI